MERINQKLSTMLKALETLQSSIELFDNYKKSMSLKNTKIEEKVDLGLRDSIIQRFEYCTDLLWKLLKIYLEDVEKVTLLANTPSGIIRAAVQARIMTEEQGQQCLEMIKDRNITSHIYREEIAEDIKSKVPRYFDLQTAIVTGIERRM